jgi:hypothetical protein
MELVKDLQFVAMVTRNCRMTMINLTLAKLCRDLISVSENVSHRILVYQCFAKYCSRHLQDVVATSELDLLWDLLFTAKQFILGPSPSRIETRYFFYFIYLFYLFIYFFAIDSLRSLSLCYILSLEVCLLRICLPFVKCAYRPYIYLLLTAVGIMPFGSVYKVQYSTYA